MRLYVALAIASSLVSNAYGFCSSYPGTREEVAHFEEQFRSSTQNQVSNYTGVSAVAKSVPVYWNIFFVEKNATDGNYS
jgi:hypothetical protein